MEVADTSAAPVDTAPAAPVVEAPASPAAAPAAAAPAAPAGPTTLHEAMFGEKAESAETNRGKGPRALDGKFVPKTSADADPAKPAAAAPAAPAATAPKPADENAMPEGLTAKAQERFQALANENKTLKAQVAPVAELTEKLDTATRQVEYVKTKFHEHAVRPEQFEQATTVIGMLNRGDYQGATKVLQTQLQQIAILSGQPIAQIDPLEHFPDLRQAVEGMQMTEAYAMEIARGRATQFAGERQRQHQEQTQQQQQAERQAVEAGTKAVDAFCKDMQGKDVDFAAIEEQLLPEIPNLLRGVPPAQWRATIEANYRLLKSTASRFRQTTTPGGNALRPTGQGSPATAPRSIHEAMWGGS